MVPCLLEEEIKGVLLNHSSDTFSFLPIRQNQIKLVHTALILIRTTSTVKSMNATKKRFTVIIGTLRIYP